MEKVMNFDYKQEINIDPGNLDLECLEHAGRFQRYSQEAAEAKMAMEKGKRELEVTTALVELDVRKQAIAKDLKQTESTIKALCTVDPRMTLAHEKFHDLRKNYEILSTAVAAFEHRKTNISDLVKLHGQGYFSSPEPRPLVRERVKKQTDDRINDLAMGVLKRMDKTKKKGG
jgi:hypothetical protein